MRTNFLAIVKETMSSTKTLFLDAYQMKALVDKCPEKVLSWEPVIPELNRSVFKRNSPIVTFKVVVSK